MKIISLRPADPGRDFGQLAAWFTILEGETNTEESLKGYYEREKHRVLRTMVAEDGQGDRLGFTWVELNREDVRRSYFYLYVKPEQRCRGVGGRLYGDLEQAAREAGVNWMRVDVLDTAPEDRAFAERRGYTEFGHRIAMSLDLAGFDDRPYEVIIEHLKAEGFQFTSMEELGDTEEAQRRLYALNDSTSMDEPGTDGGHPWDSFEDFQKRVCHSSWYKPGGQFVVIDTHTGEWAAMSAITRLEGNDYAYNLHTGVSRPYRGRKLAQAIKIHALRYARDVLQAVSVHTHHRSVNLPMIAIDRKLGYVQTPGMYLMEKMLG